MLPTKSTLTASVLTHSLFTSSYWQTPQSGTLRQSNPTSHLCSLLCTVCTVSSTAHVQNSVLNNECLDKYAFHLCSSPSALGLRAPRDRPDARVQKGVASTASALFSSSQVRTASTARDSVVSIVADSTSILASPLVVIDRAFLFNEAQPLLQLALTDNHDFH